MSCLYDLSILIILPLLINNCEPFPEADWKRKSWDEAGIEAKKGKEGESKEQRLEKENAPWMVLGLWMDDEFSVRLKTPWHHVY